MPIDKLIQAIQEKAAMLSFLDSKVKSGYNIDYNKQLMSSLFESAVTCLQNAGVEITNVQQEYDAVISAMDQEIDDLKQDQEYIQDEQNRFRDELESTLRIQCNWRTVTESEIIMAIQDLQYELEKETERADEAEKTASDLEGEIQDWEHDYSERVSELLDEVEELREEISRLNAKLHEV